MHLKGSMPAKRNMANLAVCSLLDDFVSLLDDTSTSTADKIYLTNPVEAAGHAAPPIRVGVPNWVDDPVSVASYGGQVVSTSE